MESNKCVFCNKNNKVIPLDEWENEVFDKNLCLECNLIHIDKELIK